MVECWQAEPSRRPTMPEAVAELKVIQESLSFQ